MSLAFLPATLPGSETWRRHGRELRTCRPCKRLPRTRLVSYATAERERATSPGDPSFSSASSATPAKSQLPSTPARASPAPPPSLRASRARAARGYESVLDCVLKVFCTHCEPNYELPWAMTAQRQSTSSAFVIQGRRILTNAHSVEHYTSVMVKKRYNDTKYAARVVAIGNECDIALLSVSSEEFWDDFDEQVGMVEGRQSYLSPGPLPDLQDPVLVIGYPSPGNQISVTAGVSSRVEMQHYVHGQDELLAVQIDAAINPGNSGGPVINENHEVVGIAFQSVDPSQADSVGYFIPFCIVQHFLDDIAFHGRYTGFPFCGFRWQRMENRHLRKALGLSGHQSGILVKWVAETADAARVLQKGDIVTHIDGISVSNAGTVPFRSGERIGLDFMVTSKFSHDYISVTYLRGKEQREESYRLSPMGEHRLVQVHDARQHYRRQPEYLMYGGLVFQVLSEPFLRAVYGNNWILEAPVRLIDEYYTGKRTKAGRMEIVVLAQVLVTDTTCGYDEEGGNEVVIVNELNGRLINSLKHLSELLDECTDDCTFLRFELADESVIIIDRMAAADEESAILATHCMATARSVGADEKNVPTAAPPALPAH